MCENLLKRNGERKMMKKMTYYVVELSFSNNNPIHRSVCFHRVDGNVELFGSYEGVIHSKVEDLAFFKIVEEIPSMSAKYENQNKLPTSIAKHEMEKFEVCFTKFSESTLGITNSYVLSAMPKTEECETVEAENDVTAINKLAEKYGVGRIGSILSVKAL